MQGEAIKQTAQPESPTSQWRTSSKLQFFTVFGNFSDRAMTNKINIMKKQAIQLFACLLFGQVLCLSLSAQSPTKESAYITQVLYQFVQEQPEVIHTILEKHSEDFKGLMQKEDVSYDNAAALIAPLLFYLDSLRECSFTLQERLSSYHWKFLLAFLYYYKPTGANYAALSFEDKTLLSLINKHLLFLNNEKNTFNINDVVLQ
tara:strand:+ start:1938 stop:2546 length:609 start_codon:yes stop_codon:yes gene_type:complete